MASSTYLGCTIEAWWSGTNIQFYCNVYGSGEFMHQPSFQGVKIIFNSSKEITLTSSAKVSAATLLSKGINISSNISWYVSNPSIFKGQEVGYDGTQEGGQTWVSTYYYLSQPETYSGDINACPGTTFSGSITPNISVTGTASHSIKLSAQYSNWNVGDNVDVKYGYRVERIIGDKVTTVRNATGRTDKVLSTAVTTSSSARHTDASAKTVGGYQLTITATGYFKDTSYTLDSIVVSTTVNATFYPTEDGPVELDAAIAIWDTGEHSFVVDLTESSLDSVMGYTIDKYYLSYGMYTNKDADVITTLDLQNPHSGWNDVTIYVAAEYTTLESAVAVTEYVEKTARVYYTDIPPTVYTGIISVDNEPVPGGNVSVSQGKTVHYNFSSSNIEPYAVLDIAARLHRYSDNKVYSIRLDESLNSHLSQFYCSSGHRRFDGTLFPNNGCGGYIETVPCADTLNITNHYPSPIQIKNIPLSQYNIVKWDGTIASSYESGSGTQDDPYIIATPAQLAWMIRGEKHSGATYDKYYKIKDGIDAFDMGGYRGVTLNTTPGEFQRISEGTSNNTCANLNRNCLWYKVMQSRNPDDSRYYFSGDFDGNGVVIFNIADSHTNGSGLFPIISQGNTVVRNIILRNCCFGSSGAQDNCSLGVGAIIGQSDNSQSKYSTAKISVENCIVSGCRLETQGASYGLVFGAARYSEVSIRNCLVVDTYASRRASDDYIPKCEGGLLSKIIVNNTKPLKIENCVVIGHTPNPIQHTDYTNTSENEKIDADRLYYNSGQYKCIYTDVVEGTNRAHTNVLGTPRMRDKKAEIFMKDLDWTVWTASNNTEPDLSLILSQGNSYVNVRLDDTLTLYAPNGGIKQYTPRNKDEVYIEMYQTIYSNSGYYATTDESHDIAIMNTCITIPVKIILNEDTGEFEYKYGQMYIKTPQGYKEASAMFTYNKNWKEVI